MAGIAKPVKQRYKLNPPMSKTNTSAAVSNCRQKKFWRSIKKVGVGRWAYQRYAQTNKVAAGQRFEAARWEMLHGNLEATYPTNFYAVVKHRSPTRPRESYHRHPHRNQIKFRKRRQDDYPYSLLLVRQGRPNADVLLYALG